MNDDKLPVDLKNYFSLAKGQSLQSKFMNAKTASEKVDFCLQLIQENRDLEDVILQPDLLKDELRAKRALDRALIFMESNDYDEALKQLNEGLCFAASDALGQLYGLRARIYFELGLHQLCLENVGLANGCGDPNLELDKVRDKCLNSLLSGVQGTTGVDYSVDDVHLSYPPHPNIPFIAECINLKFDKIYGRNLVTDRDLRPGDIIMMERPFSPMVEPQATYTKCSNCLSFNFYNLIPCPDSSTAMFCSKMCYQEAYKKYHKYEHKIGVKLQEWFNAETCVAFRLVVLALNTFPDINDFKTLSRDVNRYAENQFEFDFKNPDVNTVFKTLCSLTTVENDRTAKDLLEKAQIAAVLYTLLKTNEDMAVEGHEAFIKEIIYQFIQVTTINTFELYSHPELVSEKRSATAEVENFAISSYPLSSFLSHSCSPNVRKARAGKNHEIMLIFVVRPIRRGDRICDCYDQQNNHMNRSLEERNDTLYNQYFFMCKCEACTHHYPTAENLVAKLKPSDWSEIEAGLSDGDTKEAAQKNIEVISTFLNDYDEFYPCTEILAAQNQLHENIRKLCTKPSFVYH